MSIYPDGMRLRPLLHWPGQFPTEHVRSPFSTTLTNTLAELDLELRHLGDGRRPAPSVLELALREDDFRVDGLPRSNARTQHPGVILHIESCVGPLSNPAANFTTWQDNLRAITLGLNGLRRLERYGITPGSEQYQGWKQLPAAGTGSATRDARSAERFLRDLVQLAEAPVAKVYRAARAKTHPDRSDDTAESRRLWDAVEAAGEVLRRAGMLP